MNWNDFEAVWKRQELPRGTDANLETLRNTFEGERRKLAATIMVRDWLELIACVIVIVTYVLYWKQSGASAWPMGIAILLILSVAIFFIRERLRARSRRLGIDASLRAKIDADLAELRHQRHLVRRLWVWYLGPCTGALLMHGIVIFQRAKPWDVIREPLFVAGEVLFFSLLVFFAWLINRRALLRRIEPRIAELEKLLRDLVSPQ